MSTQLQDLLIVGGSLSIPGLIAFGARRLILRFFFRNKTPPFLLCPKLWNRCLFVYVFWSSILVWISVTNAHQSKVSSTLFGAIMLGSTITLFVYPSIATTQAYLESLKAQHYSKRHIQTAVVVFILSTIVTCAIVAGLLFLNNVKKHSSSLLDVVALRYNVNSSHQRRPSTRKLRYFSWNDSTVEDLNKMTDIL